MVLVDKFDLADISPAPRQTSLHLLLTANNKAACAGARWDHEVHLKQNALHSIKTMMSTDKLNNARLWS